MIVRIVIFLLANFAALALGGLATSKGVMSDWYLQLDKAPWTPPGWVFGAAWTSIMICFSVYMSLVWAKSDQNGMLLALYILQWILNVAWNPVFFKMHAVLPALVIILALTALVFYFLLNYRSMVGWGSLLILPYAIWMLIASSLNLYIQLKN